MRNFLFYSFLTVFGLLTTNSLQAQTLLLRSPDISQEHITFVYGGDIWVADREGQHPRRLTVNPGVEQNPIFSPDGSTIAFTGNYDGNTDVYTTSIHGGNPKRVTYHPAPDVVRGWLNNEEVYFTTLREYQYSLGARLYTSGINGKVSSPLLMPEAYQGTPSPDGRYWAYLKNTDPTERERVAFKRYRGGGMPSIWIFDTETHEITPIPGDNSNDVKPIWIGGKVYFLSDREKIVNIFSYDVKTQEVEKLTHFTDYDVRTLQGDENDLIFEQEGQIHLYNLVSKKTKILPITIHADALHKRSRFIEMNRNIRQMAISPTGKRALFNARGEIFTVPQEKGEARNISNSPGSHEQFPAWSPNGKWISYISDEKNQYQLVLRDQKAKEDPVFISLGDGHFYFAPKWSPDSKKLFFNDAHLNLFYIDIKTKKITKVDDDKLASITGRTNNHFQPSWSPDSEWIAYVKSLNNGVRTLFMYNISSGKSQQITDGMSHVNQPTFSENGKYLFFSASTNIGLTNSGLHMSAYEKSVNYHVYAFILSNETPSMFKNESDEEEVKKEKKDEKEGEEQKKKKEEKKDTKEDKNSEESEKIKVDFTNINTRIQALPLPAGHYQLNGKVKDKLLFLRGGTLGSFDLKKIKEENLGDGIRQFAISADGKKMLVNKGKDYMIVDAGKKVGSNQKSLKLNGIKQLVDPTAEWEQVFNEVWAMQKEFFYVKNMHGANWEAIKHKYQKFLPYVSHRSDLGYLLNEMMGEMVVGHNYIYPGDQPSTPSVSVGVLGADLRTKDDAYQIQKIFTPLDWNPSLKAPLAEPGIKVEEGNYIVGVNGQKIGKKTNIYQLLENTVDRQTSLNISSTPSFDDSWEIIIKPISYTKELSLRRMDWVETNRKKVDKLSDGQIAYVYMPNTANEGYTFFNRYYFSQMDKKALLLDERNNGGGSVADYVIDLLSRELISGWTIRDGKPFTTPGNGIYGPKAMIINENAGSGGDMMPYMFRYKGLGKLVGRTTMGILVGISGYPPLLDGGRITSPNFGVFNLDGEYIIENKGVEPDIFVEQTPKELLEGKDPQLERTVELLLEEMKEYPYKEIKSPKDPIRVN